MSKNDFVTLNPITQSYLLNARHKAIERGLKLVSKQDSFMIHYKKDSQLSIDKSYSYVSNKFM